MATTGACRDSDYPPPGEPEEECGGECNLFRCVCCWLTFCRPHVPRFAPGLDVYTTRAAAAAAAAAGDGGDRATWSVLVGCTAGLVPFHNLRLHRFRVAASGRIIGRSGDALETVATVSPPCPGDGTAFIDSATAALAPGGPRRLFGCYVQEPGSNGALVTGAGNAGNDDAQPTPQLPHRAFAVDLDTGSVLSPPAPPLPFYHGDCAAVSAHGKLWAPSTVLYSDERTITARVVMHRLDDDDGAACCCWVEAASVHMPSDYHLIGHAVIADRFILLSLVDDTFFSPAKKQTGSTFFCFDCAAGTLTPVKRTTAGGGRKYIPISGKGVHVAAGEDGDGGGMVVYFLWSAALFAYRLSEDEEGKLCIAPPVKVERLWPYYEEGHGRITHLAGRMLCAVWMNMHLPCGCAQRHALITTFLVRSGGHVGDDGGAGIEVLHSTCRGVDMLRSKAVPIRKTREHLRFLQEYPDPAGCQVDDDVDPSMLVPIDPSSPTMAEITDDMPDCCRSLLSGGAPILKECTSVVTKPDLYFICQSTDLSHVYHIGVTRAGKLTCHGQQLLLPHLSLDTVTPGVECAIDEPTSWHFVQQVPPNKLYVIPSAPARSHYEVDVSTTLWSAIELERPRGDVWFSVVSRAGQHIVALGDTLQDVYVLDEAARTWLQLPVTTPSVPGYVDLMTREVNISGFVDLIHDDILVVSDADVAGCFLLDLRKQEWFVVEPPSGVWQSVEGVLCGRCLFAEGFLFACTCLGFIALELLKEEDDTCYRLGWPVLMEFPCIEFLVRKMVSFDLIGNEVNPNSLVLCVVEGDACNAPFTSLHKLIVTTIEVKLQETAKGRRVPVRIDHIDMYSSTVDHEGWIWTSHAFSL